MAYQIGLGNEMLEWPYPIKYDTINHVTVDVLVIGGGLAGCSEAVSAARRGMKVAVADKAPIRRSGNGGAGMDHWNMVLESPTSPINTDDFIELCTDNEKNGNFFAHRDYIAIKGTWDALLELEKMGLPIKDEDGDFDNTATKDNDTNILKAYDYREMISVKLRGGNYIKPVLYDGVKAAGGEMYDRVMITSLLTEGGKQGTRVVGATGFSLETGEFYVFHTKSVIISTGYTCSMWIYSMEITGNSFRWDPNEIGEGLAMAYNAGAHIYGGDRNGAPGRAHPFAWPRFGVGGCGNTWFPCTVVDNNGKEIPWKDDNGEPVLDVEMRNMPANNQIFAGGGPGNNPKGIELPNVIKDLPRKAEAGEYEMPYWADLSAMPERERRSIWGMMVGNEGKTRYTLYDLYTRLGYNPEKHLLWCPIEANRTLGSFHGMTGASRPWRSEFMRNYAEIVTDWNGMSNIGGVFAAGAANGLEGCSYACSSGFYAGNRAAEYSDSVPLGEINQEQLNAERERVYAPVKRADSPEAYISWKELWGGTTRVMQTCCAELLTVPILEFGINWLKSIKNTEAKKTFARNPHELARVLECETRITVSDMIMRSCLAKLQSEDDGSRFMFTYLKNDEFSVEYKENMYWLKAPYAPTYRENYEKCRSNEPKIKTEE